MSQRNLSKIARSEAVTQLGSSEQLDQRLIVITSSSWIILVVAGLLLTLCLAWGYFGSLQNLVEGEGVIAPKGTQPIQINSPNAVGKHFIPVNTIIAVPDPSHVSFNAETDHVARCLSLV